jgi:tetratricopeptide (TPR) repeat protein
LVRLENDNPAYYCRLGEALFASGRTSESEAAYFQASQIDPGQPDHYYFQIAHLFAKNGFPAEAQRLLAACITANPATPIYHCYLGDVLIGQGSLKEALAAYDSAIRCDSAGAGAYYNRLGNSLMKESLFNLAVDAFQKAIDCEAAPTFYFNLAAAYKALGKTRQAEDTLKLAGAIKSPVH